jgi:hypothetical protein
VQKLIDLNDGQLLERGIFPSLGDNTSELWKVASNIDFLSRQARKTLGYTKEAETSRVTAITQAYVEGNRRAYYAETENVYLFDEGLGAPLRIGSGFSGLGRWSLEPWGTCSLSTA